MRYETISFKQFRPNSRVGTKIAWIVLCALTVFATPSIAQKPQAALPRVYLDTTFNQPIGGTTWAAHTATQFSSALTAANPGDVIVLDAGTTYTGNFYLRQKSNPNGQWIYIISSALASLPDSRRVATTDAPKMPKIVTINTTPAVQINGGADHWRLVGLEIYSASTYGCQPKHDPPINCYTYALVGPQNGGILPLPDSITIDRCYIHGSNTQDVQRAVNANGSNFAVIDTYIDNIHLYGAEAQGIVAYYTPGPIKIVNDYIAASTENIMFGGGGGATNPYVPSDIEVRSNLLYKSTAWIGASTGSHTMVVKNAFELKSAQRVLFDHNKIQNVWANGQNGYAIVLTVRTSQSGDVAVVNDITITNNRLLNVVSGFNTLAADDTCGTSSYPNCQNAGSQARWYIANNLMTFYDPTAAGGLRNNAIMFNGGTDRVTDPNNPVTGAIHDVVFQHNTTVPASTQPCWDAVFFSDYPQVPVVTSNVWILDNAFCRQPTGDYGWLGLPGITTYMGLPSTAPYDVTHRYYGNVMYVPTGDSVQTWPAHNYASTVPFTYIGASSGNYQLKTPNWTDTSDGKIAGVQNPLLP